MSSNVFNFISSDEDFVANADELSPSIADLEVNLDFHEILKNISNSTATFEQTGSTGKGIKHLQALAQKIPTLKLPSQTNGHSEETKKSRTSFTPKQIIYMEKVYRLQNYLKRTERLQIAEILDLPEDTVKVWFQNKRMRDKRLHSKGQVLNEIPSDKQNCNVVVPPQTFDEVPKSYHPICQNRNYTTACAPRQFGTQQEVPNTHNNQNRNYTMSCMSRQFGSPQEVPHTYQQVGQSWNGFQQEYQGSNPSLVATHVNITNENCPYPYYGNLQLPSRDNNGNWNYHNC